MEEKKIGYRAVILVVLMITTVLILFALNKNNLPFKSGKQGRIDVGFPVPDFTFPGLDGKMVSLSDHKGKVVIVNIWATWCPPCVDEMPSMERLYQKFRGNNFEILAVSIDSEGLKTVAPFMKKHKLTFPALIDVAGSIKTAYGATGVPESFIVDRDGILIKKIIGPLNWVRPEIIAFLNNIVQRP